MAFRIIVAMVLSVLFISCGNQTKTQGRDISTKEKNIIIFNNVSKTTVDIFSTYYDSKYANKNYYNNKHKECNKLGFKYLKKEYLEKNTYSKIYIDKEGIYNCLEIYSQSQMYKGNINSVMTTDFI